LRRGDGGPRPEAPHRNVYKFSAALQILEIPNASFRRCHHTALSGHPRALRIRKLMRFKVPRFCCPAGRPDRNSPGAAGVSRSVGPADWTACADSPRQIIRRETHRRTWAARSATSRAWPPPRSRPSAPPAIRSRCEQCRPRSISRAGRGH
jgi:hypothetical protein